MKLKIVFFIIFFIGFVLACENVDMPDAPTEWKEFGDTTLHSIEEEKIPNLEVKEGYVSQHKESFRIIRNNEVVAVVKLFEPIVVAQADKDYPWGYFQFPIIYRNENGDLVVKYQMRSDSQSSYGEDSYEYKMSKDEGQTWIPVDRDYFHKERYRIDLKNGDFLQVKDIAAFDISKYSGFPAPVNEHSLYGYDFYRESQLPEELRGVYFDYVKSGNTSTTLHSQIKDDDYLRYSLNGLMPIVWWGDIKQLDNGRLIAGVYPSYYQNNLGQVLKSGVSFYESDDLGRSWSLKGHIPCFRKGDNISYIFDTSEGFSEPSFEILNNGTFLCVMRTGRPTPMYKSISLDRGKTWTIPEPFTPNGVMPNLLTLDNGIVVLVSGRPGLQLRFSLDGNGDRWTYPIEMLPYMDENGSFDMWKVGCGYANLLKCGENSFLMVYSDFKLKNEQSEERKTILCRKVEVAKR